MSKIALFGAAGGAGRSIAAVLRERGTRYRVVGRGRTELERAFGDDPLAEIVTWNPDDPASVRAAAEGIDTLIYLVGVPYDQFRLHPIVMEQTLAGAVAAGVERFVLLGNVYPYGRPQTATVAESHPREPHTSKGRYRKQQEDLLLQAHADGKLRGTILRVPDFYGPGIEKSFLHRLFVAAASGGTADLLGPIDVPHEFAFIPDVAPVVLDLAAKDEAYGRWWNLAGAGVTTQRELAERAFAQAGRAPKLRVLNKTMLRAAGLFDPTMRELVEMHYLLETPVLLDDSALRALLGTVRKTSYDDGVRASLAAYRGELAIA